MKCNYKPPKLSKEDRQELASLKSTLPYINRMEIEKKKKYEMICQNNDELETKDNKDDIV